MLRNVLPLGLALMGATSVFAADEAECSLDKKCPEESPCCSQYGQCGVGAYCLGGCDPRMSFSLDSCVPAPVCESKTYSMKNTDGLVSIDKYLGDSTKADWVCQGEPREYNGNVVLTMPAHSVGTVCATTTYMWYGNVKARLKASRGAGVVTAFILLSDVKDEIDYEYVGVDSQTAQTNFYYQGIPDYDNTGNISVADSYNKFHDYEIRWTPQSITWLIDGKEGRVQEREPTFNKTDNTYHYPQTPARVQISIWPGGADSNPKGTVDWAGGPIDWESDDIKKNGYYFSTFGEITTECYDGKDGVGTHDGTSYTYTDRKATEDDVKDGDKKTVLKSFQGTGTDMDAGADPSKSKGSGATSTKTADGATKSIPGGSSGGTGSSGQAADQANGGDGNSGSGSGSSDGGSGTSSSDGCKTTGFSQSCADGSSGGGGKNGGARVGEQALGASLFGAIVAFAGMLML